MRHLWDRGAQAGAELEALQTDVMRFMAILGLCLAAIFSLLRSAEQERATPEAAEVEPVLEPAPVSPPSPEPAVRPEPGPPEPEPVEEEVTAPAVAVEEPPEEGFTLEFESNAAMTSLLEGGLAELYLLDGDQFFRYTGGGGFAAVAAPDSYYAMQPETVPRRLRDFASGLLTRGDVAWGVSLPASTELQLQDLLRDQQGGALVIDGRGGVRLE